MPDLIGVPAHAEAQCVATYAFRGGRITGQALIRLGDP